MRDPLETTGPPPKRRVSPDTRNVENRPKTDEKNRLDTRRQKCVSVYINRVFSDFRGGQQAIRNPVLYPTELRARVFLTTKINIWEIRSL